ncbi:MAG: DUF2318 domain-containing protein [Desulfobacteraceae bacterium]
MELEEISPPSNPILLSNPLATMDDPKFHGFPSGCKRYLFFKARHFDFKAGELTVRYFILKSSDGVIRAAFDACDVCWPAGKGYYQKGDEMVCRNCGRRFASVLVNEVQGGCNPAPLNRRVEGDQLILRVEDILTGKSYFNFKEKV